MLTISLQLTQRKTTILNSFFTEKLLSTGYDGVLRYYRKVYVEYLLIMCLVPEYIHISTQEKLFESDGILVLFNDKRNHWTFMVQYIYLKLREFTVMFDEQFFTDSGLT